MPRSERWKYLLSQRLWFVRKGKNQIALSFIRKLADLLNSGVSINRALRIIQEGLRLEGDASSLSFVDNLSQSVESGRSLQDSMKVHDKLFDTMTLSLIHIGEESGQLPQVLKKIVGYLEDQAKYKRQLVKALTYPVLVLMIASLTVVFLTYFLLPMFSEMYQDMNMELPGFTRMLLNLSENGGTYFLGLALLVVVVSMAMRRLWKIPSINQKLIQLIRKTPIAGKMISSFTTSYYTQICVTLLESGLTLLHSIEICHQIARGSLTRGFFGYVARTLKEGRSFSQVLMSTGMLEYEYVQLIQLSEESGELTPTLAKINKQITEDLENKLEGMSTILEPLIIVFVGFAIGAVVVGMYLPIFEMSSTMNF